jgi:hypothetical protein
MSVANTYMTKGRLWAFGYPSKEGIIHTWPIFQSEKHCLEGATCYCCPKIILEERVTIIAHNIIQ